MEAEDVEKGREEEGGEEVGRMGAGAMVEEVLEVMGEGAMVEAVLEVGKTEEDTVVRVGEEVAMEVGMTVDGAMGPKAAD
eukprot:scaffold695_cov384-Prasinococcus_capsulatus_cf.AAC.2